MKSHCSSKIINRLNFNQVVSEKPVTKLVFKAERHGTIGNVDVE